MAKYKNYKQLSEAFKSGSLDKKKYYLMLDKGGTENSLCHIYNPSLSEAENEREDEKASKMFSGEHEIETVFEALGIPCEWC